MIQASWNGVFERWQELSDLEVHGASRWYWMAYAAPYSWSQNLAQYLGSRSMKAAMRFKWWNKVDELIMRGV